MPVYYPQAHGILRVVFDGFGSNDNDSEPKVIPVRPSRAVVVRNSYRQADSWELTFEAEDFPMDPQMVRTGQAEIWLYASPSYENMRLVETHGSLGVPVIPRSLIDASQDGAEAAAGNLDRKGRKGFKIRRPTVAGLFDEHSIEYSNSGKWVTISGQDYTALLIAKQWPPLPNGRARKIPIGARLDVLLRRFLAAADTTGRLELVVEGIRTSEIPQVRKGTRSNKFGIPVEQDTSYWDVMYKLTIRHGLILFVRGTEVVLARPFNIGAHNVGRTRSMEWGSNLEHLEMSRKMGKETAPSIIVRGYDESGKAAAVAEYPKGTAAKIKAGTLATKTTGGGKTKKGKAKKTNIKHSEEYQVVPAWGISDPVVLQEMARSLFTLLGKSERIVRFRTKDLTDLMSKDLMDLATGDGFIVTIKEWIRDAAALRDQRLGLAERVHYLESRGYAPAIARLVAEKYQQIDFLSRPLRVREVTYDFSEDEGISIEAELVDFIVIDGIRDAEAKTPRKRTERLAASSAEPLTSRAQRDANRKQGA